MVAAGKGTYGNELLIYGLFKVKFKVPFKLGL
jgi:hypothetical protein